MWTTPVASLGEHYGLLVSPRDIKGKERGKCACVTREGVTSLIRIPKREKKPAGGGESQLFLSEGEKGKVSNKISPFCEYGEGPKGW